MSSAKPNSFIKRLSDASLFIFAKGLIVFTGWIPHRMCLWIGSGVGNFIFKLLKSRQKVALDNLLMIYGNALTPQVRMEIAKGNFAHLTASLLELFHVVGRSSEVKRLVHVQGEEYLTRVLEQGKGAVVFSAHMGNFVLMPVAFTKMENVKFLYRAPSDPLLARIYRWMIDRMHVQVIEDNPRPLCALKCIKHLKRKGIIIILIDQVENGGIYVDFMGKPAGSTVGAATMALMCQAPLVPMHCIRMPDSSLQVELEPEYLIEREGEIDKLLEPAVAGMNKVVEKWVRANPVQWLWGHRRWRLWRK